MVRRSNTFVLANSHFLLLSTIPVLVFSTPSTSAVSEPKHETNMADIPCQLKRVNNLNRATEKSSKYAENKHIC